ncbi:MAG: SPOR domain-containing protein [Candidatus Aminicenantes bacterium]|nr:SPOR domain-containing protein [Candidatus Aminicenantes bacterium]
MSKSDEFREMQISSGQLAAVILVLLALCVFIFYLGTRVGMKKAAASSPPAATKTQAKADPSTKFAPSISELAGQIQKPAGAETAKPQTPVPEKSKTTESKPSVKTEQNPAAAVKKPAAAEPKPKTVSPSGTYYIQAGALDTREKGETLARRIEGLSFRAIVLNPLAGDRKPVYRVRVGPYETKESAETAREKLAEALKRKTTDFFLVKG